MRLSSFVPSLKAQDLQHGRIGIHRRILRMIIPIALICALSRPIPTCSALDIDGDNFSIDAAITWQISDSPINVKGELTVGSGGSLVIESGVRVIFDSTNGITSSITVGLGGLLAIMGGTSDGGRVILEPSEEDGSWGGITFEAGAISAMVDETFDYDSGSIIQYADIIQAGHGSIYSSVNAIDCSLGAVPYILGVTLISSGGHYYGSGVNIYDLKGTFVARNLRIVPNTTAVSVYSSRRGLNIVGSGIGSGSIVLENIDVARDASFEAVTISSAASLRVSESVLNEGLSLSYIASVNISANNLAARLSMSNLGGEGSSIHINENSIEISEDQAGQALVSYNWKPGTDEFSQVQIARNTIRGGVIDVQNDYYWWGGNYINITIESNSIIGSTRGGIHVRNLGDGHLIMTKNSVRDCISPDIPVIRIHSHSSATTAFRQNGVEQCVGSALVKLDGHPLESFEENIFSDNTAVVSVDISQMSSAQASIDYIRLPRNYWGNYQSDLMGLRKTVRDAFYDLSIPAIVDFDQMLSAADIHSDLIPMDLPSLFRSDGSVGGLASSASSRLSGSTYVANASIIVPKGIHLEIGIDTTIYFAPMRGILVQQGGKLSVLGPVKMKPSQNIEWAGLILETTNKTILRDVIIDSSHVGIQQINGGFGSLHIEDTTITRTFTKGIDAMGSSVDIIRSEISEAGDSGIGINEGVQNFRLLNSTLSNSSSSELYADYKSRANITLENNVVNSFKSSSAAFRFDGFSTLRLRQNMLRCRYQCLQSDYGNPVLVIENNIFSGIGFDHSYRMVSLSEYYYSSASVIVVFEGNEINDWKTDSEALYINPRLSSEAETFVLRSNEFSNIEAKQIMKLDFPSCRFPTNISNIFGPNLTTTDNEYPALLYIQQWPDNAEENLCTLRGNVFYNSSSESFAVVVRQNANQDSRIDASLSYWGATDETIVTKRIYDGTDDPGTAILSYLPYFLTPDPLGPRSSNETTTRFLGPGSKLGGILPKGENVTLSASGSPYFSEGSLIIDGIFELQPGVILAMTEDSSIIVREGEMVAKGTTLDPILFTSNDEGGWAGIHSLDSAKGFTMEHARIENAGTSNEYALAMEQGGSSSVYRDISIENGTGYGLRVGGDGSYIFEDLTIGGLGSNGAYYSRSVYITGNSNVTIIRLDIQSDSTSALYADSQSIVYLNDVIVDPLSDVDQIGVHLYNKGAHINGLRTGVRQGRPIYVSSSQLSLLTVKNSYMHCTQEIDIYTHSTSLVKFENNSIFWSSTTSSCFKVQRAGSVHFVHNIMGSSLTNFPSSLYSSLISIRDTYLLEFERNTIVNRSDDSSYPYLLVSAEEAFIRSNKFDSLKGHNLLQTTGFSYPNFTENYIMDSTFKYHLFTDQEYGNIEGGVVRVGPNYWGTTNFDDIRLHDSRVDARLVTIVITSIYKDEAMANVLLAPPPKPLVDMDNMTIGGTILDGVEISVPPGLYYAEKPIVLRHPVVELTLQAGVRIIFAPKASIRVDQGTLKISGNEDNVVYLGPTKGRAGEHGNAAKIENTTDWGGLFFGPDARNTDLSSAKEYLGGSMIRYCSVEFGGYSWPPKVASIHIVETNVMISGVSVIGMPKYSVDGIRYEMSDSALDMKIVVKNVDILEAGGYGITIYRSRGSILSNLSVSSCKTGGLYFSSCSNVGISKSVIEGNKSPWYSTDQVYSSGSENFTIIDCVISNSSQFGVRLHGHDNVHISGSEFSRSKMPLHISSDEGIINIELNQFHENSCTECRSIELTDYHELLFRGNTIDDNAAGSQILHVGSSYSSNLIGNVFSSNSVDFSTSGAHSILAISGYGNAPWNIHGNEFSNSVARYEISTFDYSGSTEIVNATRNYFASITGGSLSASEIADRIYDKDEDSSKPLVVFEPYFTTNVTTLCSNSCPADRGSCVYPGICVCKDGWAGSACDAPTCRSLNFCSGRGLCTSFNKCTCDEGWLGLACDINVSPPPSTALSIGPTDNKGSAAAQVPSAAPSNAPSQLPSSNSTTVVDCPGTHRLVSGECRECPICLNDGFCNDDAQCDCLGNFAGSTCNNCKKDYFGPTCSPFPYISSIFPIDADVVGGSTILVSGRNFGSNSSFQCHFEGAGSSNASLSGENDLICETPAVAIEGTFQSSLRIYMDGEASFNSVPFVFYASCPPVDECNDGFCTFGRCQCYPNFRGDHCDEEVIAPVISSLATLDVIENSFFQYQLTLEQGSQPVQWSIISTHSDDIQIGASSGLLTWDHPSVESSATALVTIVVLAINEGGQTTSELQMKVKPSYMVQVAMSSDLQDLFRPSPPIYFDFQTIDIGSFEPVGGKLADLWVYNRGTGSYGERRKISVKTDNQGFFRRSFQPYVFDAGTFLFGGEHPSIGNETIQGEFSVLGFDIEPEPYYWRGFPGERFEMEDAFSIILRGGSFSDFSIYFDAVAGVAIEASLNASSISDIAGAISVSVAIVSDEALSGKIHFTVSTDRGEMRSEDSYVYVDVRPRRPKISILSRPIDIGIAIDGSAHYENVLIQNIGSRSSGAIDIFVPTEQRIVSSMSETLKDLEVDETATVALRFKALPGLEVGYFITGSITFAANSSDWVSLPFRATIVSLVPVNLTITTLNEASFFSEEDPKPNLADVDITVRGLASGTARRVSSGPNGTIVLSDLVEDAYEVQAQKLGHKAFRKTIFVSAPGARIDAFLQYQTVSYTFRVIPVPVLDRYEIIVETRFKTNVPAPVIDWEPKALDYDLLMSGLIDSFEMSATNLGLIKTEDLTYTFPSHMVDIALTPGVSSSYFGDLPANSTISFPVFIEQIQRFDLPDDRAELRPFEGIPNYAIFLPRASDPRWDIGPDMLIVPKDLDNQWYVKLDGDGEVEYYFSYAENTLYEMVYGATGDLVNITVLANTTFSDDAIRRRLNKVPDPIIVKTTHIPGESSITSTPKSRRLGGIQINNPRDCAKAIACEICDEVESKLMGALTKNLIPKGVQEGYEKLCKMLEGPKISPLPGVSISAPKSPGCPKPPGPPLCRYICPEKKVLGGCTHYDCNGPQSICSPRIEFPDIGDCSIEYKPGGPIKRITPGGFGGGSGSGTSGWGGGGFSGGGGGCSPKNVNNVPYSRKLGENDLPEHVIPLHRSLLNGCEQCPIQDLTAVYRESEGLREPLLELEINLLACANKVKTSGNIKSLFPCVFRHSAIYKNLMALTSQVIACQMGREHCYSESDLLDSPGLVNLFIQSKRYQDLVHLSLLSSDHMYNLTSNLGLVLGDTDAEKATIFSSILTEVMSENSQEGEAVSAQEKQRLMDANSNVTNAFDLEHFIDTWNTSNELWQQGILSSSDLPIGFSSSFFDLQHAIHLVDKFLSSKSRLREESLASFTNAWLAAIEAQQYEEAKQLAGVCAAVRVQIEQEVALTRVGFEARLEILNSGEIPLDNLTVSLRSSPSQNITEDATQLFVFGVPKVEGTSSVEGGTIAPGSTASSTWLILPLSEAAPIFETNYYISGTMQYSIEGVEYLQNLGAASITVQPDPQLHLKYFHSREVYADDPFSLGVVEPSVPFFLALLIENRGYGDAKNVEIVSSEPKIVENKKGLLIDFSMIGARIGNTSVSSKSFNIDFGDIEGRSNTVGVWEMVSTLRGRFDNFSTSLLYKGPIDDERLSLIDSVEIFELSHIVRVVDDHPLGTGLGYVDDGFDDFLVNVFPDAYYIPDHVFTSDNRQGNFTVSSVIERGTITSIEETLQGDYVVMVEHSLSGYEKSTLTDWCYIRFADPLAHTGYKLQTVIRTDVNYQLLQNYNSWQTSWTEYLIDDEIEELDFIHLFDFGVAPEYVLLYRKQPSILDVRITNTTSSSLSVSWQNAPESVGQLLWKPTSLEDKYFKLAKVILPGVSTFTLTNLASGQNFTIKVISGVDGIYDNSGGVTIVGETLGEYKCGNNITDMGEECDEAKSNGSLESNCTIACTNVIFTRTQDSRGNSSVDIGPIPSVEPSLAIRPSQTPSLFPSQLPSKLTPSGFPSLSPSVSNRPTAKYEPSEQPSESSDPSSMPSVVLSLGPSSSPSGDPSSEPSSESLRPSSKLTLWPSEAPSHDPSPLPSLSSKLPTKGVPSEKPISEPSRKPSSTPSRAPSEGQTSTSMPSSNLHPSEPPSKWVQSATNAKVPSATPSQRGHHGNSPPTVPPSSSPSSSILQPDDSSVMPSHSPSFVPTLECRGIDGFPTDDYTHHDFGLYSAKITVQNDTQITAETIEIQICAEIEKQYSSISILGCCTSALIRAEKTLESLRRLVSNDSNSTNSTYSVTFQTRIVLADSCDEICQNNYESTLSSADFEARIGGTVQILKSGPSFVPSNKPSGTPSQRPSGLYNENAHRSHKPSSVPSKDPTSVPSLIPSKWPTIQPSLSQMAANPPSRFSPMPSTRTLDSNTPSTTQSSVANTMPRVDAGLDQIVDEGTLFILNGAIFYSSASNHVYVVTINWGDKLASENGIVTKDASSSFGTITGSHVYTNEGQYTVTITIFDEEERSAADSMTVAVLRTTDSILSEFLRKLDAVLKDDNIFAFREEARGPTKMSYRKKARLIQKLRAKALRLVELYKQFTKTKNKRKLKNAKRKTKSLWKLICRRRRIGVQKEFCSYFENFIDDLDLQTRKKKNGKKRRRKAKGRVRRRPLERHLQDA